MEKLNKEQTLLVKYLATGKDVYRRLLENLFGYDFDKIDGYDDGEAQRDYKTK